MVRPLLGQTALASTKVVRPLLGQTACQSTLRRFNTKPQPNGANLATKPQPNGANLTTHRRRLEWKAVVREKIAEQTRLTQVAARSNLSRVSKHEMNEVKYPGRHSL